MSAPENDLSLPVTKKREPDPIPWALIVVLGIVIVSALAVAVIVVLGPHDLNADKALRLDAFKLVLAGVAGYGAAVTVWLGLRRQQHVERHSWSQRELDAEKQHAEDRDNQARRELELYSAAASQLGSDQAAVRLAGIYSFERLAVEAADYRQTVIEVFCAYLRMPRAFAVTDERVAEREVRSAIQALLVRHLPRRGTSEGAWGGVRIDLSGATLTDFDASKVQFADAAFIGTRFDGNTNFSMATFECGAAFERSTFEGRTSFRRVRFPEGANFEACTFSGEEVAFTGARFGGNAANFRSCRFETKQSLFRGAKFESTASTNFSKATFGETGTFKRALFGSLTTSFNHAEFVVGKTPFVGARFASTRLLVDDIGSWRDRLAGADLANEPALATPADSTGAQLTERLDTPGGET